MLRMDVQGQYLVGWCREPSISGDQYIVVLTFQRHYILCSRDTCAKIESHNRILVSNRSCKCRLIGKPAEIRRCPRNCNADERSHPLCLGMGREREDEAKPGDLPVETRFPFFGGWEKERWHTADGAAVCPWGLAVSVWLCVSFQRSRRENAFLFAI